MTFLEFISQKLTHVNLDITHKSHTLASKFYSKFYYKYYGTMIAYITKSAIQWL